MRRERGAAAVELVIAMPALLIVLLLMVATGRAVQTKQVLTDVAREAATIGAQGQSESQARTAAVQRAQMVASGLGLDASKLAISISSASFVRGADFVVRVSYRVSLMSAPGLGRFPVALIVSATHTEAIERYKSR